MEKSVIIVEDDPFSQDFYKFIFRKAGISHQIIEDGDLLISTLRTERIGLIIMDINLKNTYLNGEKTDGVRLSKLIKEDADLHTIPVILVTAYSSNSSDNKFLEESHAEDYITKPILDFNALISKVNSYIMK